MTTPKMIDEYLDKYYRFSIPTYDDVRSFVEHGREDEADVMYHADVMLALRDNHDEDRFYQSAPFPPSNQDLVELLHT